MSSTRQQIISMLRNQKYLSAREISRALDLTPANIRHHLSILEQEGVIEPVGRLTSKDRGRPAQVFTLTHQSQSHNLDRLSNALLEELLQNNRRGSSNDILARLASRLAQPLPPPSPSLTQRLYQAVQRLNELNYQARWEAHAEAPRIYLEHCPYAMLLPEHPELCQIDQLLLSTLIDHPVTLALKLAKDNHCKPYCLFIAK